MPKPVYALVGDDCFSQLQQLGEIHRELGGTSVQRIDFDGDRAQLAEVLDELRSFAMFGSGKMVVIRDADEFISRYREQIEDYLNDAPGGAGTLVLRVASLPRSQRIYKIIAKIGQIQECQAPKNLSGWIIAHAKQAHGLMIAPDAAGVLADHIGADLGRLDMELSKLALQCPASRVTVEHLQGLAFQREQEMWDMTNELAAGHPDAALRRWRRLVQLDTSAEFRAVTWLTMWLEDMRQVLGGNIGKLAWKYKDKLPLAKKTAQQLGADGIMRATELLAELDRRSKSGLGDATSNVERFIISLAK